MVGHNVLIAHAEAVFIYRTRYQSLYDGAIGIVLNLDWGEPLSPSSSTDLLAATRHNEFGLAWFADPIYFGHYPVSMQQLVGDRLPVISDALALKLKGSADFLGLNHYSTKYYYEAAVPDREPPMTMSGTGMGGWAEDQRNVESKHDINGQLIGPQVLT